MSYRYTQDQVEQVVAEVVRPLMQPGAIITLQGPLGAGKTTLVRAVLRDLGVAEAITSPTFTYVNTYKVNGMTIHHFDVYRIGSAEEFCQAGFEEYLADEKTVVLIEWPGVIEKVLMRQDGVVALDVAYDADDHGVRILQIMTLKAGRS